MTLTSTQNKLTKAFGTIAHKDNPSNFYKLNVTSVDGVAKILGVVCNGGNESDVIAFNLAPVMQERGNWDNGIYFKNLTLALKHLGK